MKKIKILYLFLLFFSVMAVLGGNVRVNAVDIAYIFNDNNWTADNGKWINYTAAKGFESGTDGRGIQANGGLASAVSPILYNNISSIEVVWSTNGAGNSFYIFVRATSTKDITTTNPLMTITGGSGTKNASVIKSDVGLSGYVHIVVPAPKDKSVWVKSIKITYNAVVEKRTVSFKNDDGNDFDPVKEQVQVDNNSSLGDKLPTAPSRENHAFVGWFTATTGGTEVTSITLITADTVLYARYIRTYQVSFDSNGGNSISPQTINSGSVATKPTNPAREGYKFLGWYKNAAETEFNFSTAITEDVTLNARWIRQSIFDFSEKTTSASMMFGYTSQSNITSGSFESSIHDNYKDKEAPATNNPYENFTVGQIINEKIFSSTDSIASLSKFKVVNKTNGGTATRVWPVASPETIIQVRAYKNAVLEIQAVNDSLLTGISLDTDVSSLTVKVGNETITPSTTGNIRTYSFNPADTVTINITNTIKIYSMGVSYSSGGINYSVTENSLAMRFGTVLEKQMYDDLINSGAEVSFGAAVYANGAITPQYLEFAEIAEIEGGAKYQMALVLDNIPAADINKVIKVAVYVCIDGVYYEMNEREFSIVTLAQEYVDLKKPEYADFMGVLKYIAGGMN